MLASELEEGRGAIADAEPKDGHARFQVLVAAEATRRDQVREQGGHGPGLVGRRQRLLGRPRGVGEARQAQEQNPPLGVLRQQRLQAQRHGLQSHGGVG